MDFSTVLLLIINTCILLVAIILVVIQSKVLKILSKKPEVLSGIEPMIRNTNYETDVETNVTQEKGTTSGETKLNGIDNEEEIAVIMAVVSKASRIPLSRLKINYIKRMDA
jgi:hypothetical protein